MQDRDLSAEYHEPKSGKVESLYNTFTVVRLYDCKTVKFASADLNPDRSEKVYQPRDDADPE